MTKYFFIKKVCSEENRPQYSYKVDEYFEDFVRKNILEAFDILQDGQSKLILSIMYFAKQANSPEGISIYEPSTVAEEKLTFYPVSINLEDVYKDGTPLENIISLYYQVISLFFLSNYKKVFREYILQLKEKLDWDYLLSLPYPASFSEQKYVAD